MRLFGRIARGADRRPARVLVVAALLVALGAGLALRLEPSAATDTLVGRSSDGFQATERYRERFGDHSIVVLVRGSLPSLVLTENLGKLLRLEGCLSGNKPRGAQVPGGARSPCGELERTRPVQVVYGPGTFINTAVNEINSQLQSLLQAKAAQAERAARDARELARRRRRSAAGQKRAGDSARQLVYAQFTRDLLELNTRYDLGLSEVPKIDDPDFVSALVFDPKRGATTPKARFAHLFPNARSAVIQVRLKPDLSERERGRAIELVRRAVAMPMWRLRDGGGYTVTGAPVVLDDLTDALAGSLLRLLFVALVVMAIALALVFRRRARLLPLGIGLGACALAYGLMAAVGAPLTMASIAVLPVLLGLGIDYAIQYQARVAEAGVETAARRAAPTIAIAAAATMVGFLVLLASPVPMVRGFGILLVVGIALAFGLALTAGTAALALMARASGSAREPTPSGVAPPGVGQVAPGRAASSGVTPPGAGPAGATARLGAGLVRSARGAAELVDAFGDAIWRGLARPRRLLARLGAGALRRGLERPGRVLAVGLALAAAGWAVDSRTEVVSDLQRLVPQDTRAVRDLEALQRTTGVAGEVDVVVEGDDLTDPKAVAWMRDYQADLLKRHGYSSRRGCGRADLCPALSLPDLFRTSRAAGDRRRIRALLDAVPPYFSQAVIARDRRTAALAFGIRLMPFERQEEVIRDMRARLRPPPGVRAELAGLPVLAAEANEALSSPARRLLTLALGLAAVALALLAAYRRWERAWVPLAPIALATGWSALILFALRVPLNPMSATLGALVIAISTEFSVLLCARFREEREVGHDLPVALRRTYRSTGGAVLASGVTAIAGFAVLALSDIRMLSDFGWVTVVDLTVSLLGVLAVLPAVLVVAERRAARVPGRRTARAAPALRA